MNDAPTGVDVGTTQIFTHPDSPNVQIVITYDGGHKYTREVFLGGTRIYLVTRWRVAYAATDRPYDDAHRAEIREFGRNAGPWPHGEPLTGGFQEAARSAEASTLGSLLPGNALLYPDKRWAAPYAEELRMLGQAILHGTARVNTRGVEESMT
jgi:hypothetical protein